jgi:hypothetical protein
VTHEQFLEWYAHHRSAFPGIDAWLGRIDRAAKSEADLRSADVLRGWRRVLADIELADAKRATDEMARGDIDEPRSFDGHAKAIRRSAKASRFERGKGPGRVVWFDGERSVRCSVCGDAGLVIVFHPKSMQAARQGTLDRLSSYSCGVACTCEARARWPGVEIEFDERTMCRCEHHPTEDDCERLRAFFTGVAWNAAPF